MQGLGCSVLLLFLLSALPSKEPKPLSPDTAPDEPYFYDTDYDTDSEEMSTPPSTPTQPPSQHAQKIRKFTIQNVFKIDPPKTPFPNPDPELRSFFTAAQTVQKAEVKSREVDMDALLQDLRRELPRVVNAILSRADRLEILGAPDMSPTGLEELRGRSGASGASWKVEEKSGEKVDYSLEDVEASGGWRHRAGTEGLNGSAMEAAVEEARAAIASVKRIDERMLRVLQGDEKCH